MDDVTKLDLYELLDILPEANEKEVKKAYRKKALSCHPDKNPDDPKAVALFHQLSKALEILTDGAARGAYDKVLKSRKAADLRNKALDSKRKKLKEELEAREKASQDEHHNSRDADARLQAEIERLRKEGSKHLEDEQEYIRQQLLKEINEEKTQKDEKILPRLKVKWKPVKGDETNGGYSYQSLHNIFAKYGEVSCLLLSSTKHGSAMVEFVSFQAAEAAVKSEKGLRTNPLKITWVQGKTSSQEKPGADDKFTGHQPSDRPMSSNTSITERDYESLVLMKMRQAEERKRLIDKMLEDEDSPDKK